MKLLRRRHRRYRRLAGRSSHRYPRSIRRPRSLERQPAQSGSETATPPWPSAAASVKRTALKPTHPWRPRGHWPRGSGPPGTCSRKIHRRRFGYTSNPRLLRTLSGPLQRWPLRMRPSRRYRREPSIHDAASRLARARLPAPIRSPALAPAQPGLPTAAPVVIASASRITPELSHVAENTIHGTTVLIEVGSGFRSGFLVHRDGLVVTACHVLEGGQISKTRNSPPARWPASSGAPTGRSTLHCCG